MANQIFVNPYPFGGVDFTQNSEIINGSIVLAGAAVSSGEPLSWQNLVTGVGYNEKNFAGNGANLNTGSALVTAFSASGGTVTAIAANNFPAGAKIAFLGNTSVLGLLLNGTTATVLTSSATQFTFTSSATGTGTSEVGLAVNISQGSVLPNVNSQTNLTAAITALSASGGIVTVTAANLYLPGANITSFSGFTAGLGLALQNAIAAGANFTVIQSTGTAFTFASTATGATGTGYVTAFNDPQPYAVDIWSAGASGYNYSYSEQTGVLFVQQGGASVSNPMANLPAAAYPAGVLADIIKFTAYFQRG
jgi:hypothetical protein